MLETVAGNRSRIGVAAAVLGAVAWALVAGPGAAAAGRFPQPPPTAPATVWAVGDGAVGSDAARAVAARAIADSPSAFLYLGDVYEYGTASDFARNYATVYGPLTPITLPTPGNHDWRNHAVGYDRYWGRATAGTTPPYYAVSLAGWRIISLNSEMSHGPGSRQLAWLRNQVRTPGTCRVAFWHRPRFSAGLHGDQADVAPFWRTLRGHAVLTLAGHDHDMQEMRPRAGITQLVSGAGGRNHYPVDEGDTRLAWSDDHTDGALRLELEPGRAGYAFIAADGRTLRSGAVTCRPRR